MKQFNSIIFLIFILIGNTYSQSIEEMLNKSFGKVSSLNSYSYKSRTGSSAPYDSVIMRQYITNHKVINEPQDAIIGARFILYLDDTTKIYTSYYNSVASRYDWNKRNISIDTLNKDRPMLNAPFFIRVKGLLKYIMENKDSVLFQVTEYTDSIKFSFVFKDKLVELDKSPFIYPQTKAISKYFLWTRKDFMPFKLTRQLPHQTSYEEILTLADCDSNEIIEKQVGIYLPKGFTIADKSGKEILTTVQEGSEAANWSLKDLKGNTFNLSDYKGKNLLIEFTGVGCGACHLAIPFLNKFADDYKDKGFHVLSIESFSDNTSVLKRYNEMNKVKYDFLIADKETVATYKIVAVPVFILVNKSGVIEKAFLGYNKDETDKDIKTIAEKM